MKTMVNGGIESMAVREYSFSITPLFQFIAERSEEAGLEVMDGGYEQTVQLFIKNPVTDVKRIGAIQYEGSNDFGKKEPDIVSWRFERNLIPVALKNDLEMITTFRKDKNNGPSVNPEAQSIVFKFQELTEETRSAVDTIVSVLKKHIKE